MKVVHTLLLATLVGASGCGSTNTPTVTTTAAHFARRSPEQGSAWRSVNVPTAGDVTVQLVSVTQAGAVMNIGIGTISGTPCVLDASVDTRSMRRSKSACARAASAMCR